MNLPSSYRVVVCEKPSVARDIATHFKARQKREGYIEGDGVLITWAFGHLLELKDPAEYKPEWKGWRLETLPMVPEEFELQPRGDKGAKHQLEIIKKLLRGSSEIICATDAGREGELIFRYIQTYAGVTKKPVRRLWVSSLTPEALATGFNKLLPISEFDSLYRAAKCRSEADWIVGLNATRYFTVLHGGQQLWSLGRVQTPILAMIVERDFEIANHKPEDYWELHSDFKDVHFRHAGGKIESLKKAEALLQKVKPAPLKITDITEREDMIRPPLLYDLTELQKDLNRRWGMSADRTLKAAQSLYERKHLTYPRTDSKYLTADVAKQLPSLLQKLKTLRPEQIAKIDFKKLDLGPRIVNELKVTDHHAILPTSVLATGSLSPDEEHVYDAVVTRVIAAFYPPSCRQIKNVKAVAAGEEFKATGSVVTDLGWEALYPRAKNKAVKSPLTKANGANAKSSSLDADAEAEEIENQNAEAFKKLKKGDEGPHKPEIKTLKTKPPLAFTEGTLLQMMETAGRRIQEEELRAALKDKGIGTPATRASIIETLIQRRYLERQKKNLVSTELGRQLIGLIDDRRLKSAELTGEWESRLKQIEKNAYDPEQFMKDVIQYTREILGKADGSKSGLGPCPLCKAPVIEGQRGFGCSQWKTGCKFVLWKEFEGAQISASVATQLLRTKRTSNPLVIQRDGKPKFVQLELDGEGRLRSHDSQAPVAKGAAADFKSIGKCPRCGGAVLDTPKAYGCTNWRQGCKFTIWKTIAKKKISQKLAKEILQAGQSEILDGFKSKKGKAFSARLVLKNFEVKIEFPNSSASSGPF